MEWASKVMSAATRASSNSTVINVVLVGSFVALSVRSVNQQRDIEALEAEKGSLVKTNKAMMKTMGIGSNSSSPRPPQRTLSSLSPNSKPSMAKPPPPNLLGMLRREMENQLYLKL